MHTHTHKRLFVLKREQCDKSQTLVRSKYLHVLIGLINDRDVSGGGRRDVWLLKHTPLISYLIGAL